MKNCPEFDLFFVFERCDATQPSFLNCLCLFAFIFLFIPVFSTISLSVGSLHLLPPPPLPARLSGILPHPFEEEEEKQIITLPVLYLLCSAELSSLHL